MLRSRVLTSSRRAAASQGRINCLLIQRAYAIPVEYHPRKAEPDPQLNGYPELPWVSLQRRPAKGWWDQQGRRNFGETLHEQYDMLDMWGPDVSNVVSPSSALKQLAVVALGIGAFAYIIYLVKPDPPAVPRQYPFGGLVKELGGLDANKVAEEPIETEDEAE